MKIKAKLVTCTHESKYGVTAYSRIVKKNQNPDDIIEEIKVQSDYNKDGYNEYFDSDVTDIVIDTDEYEKYETQQASLDNTIQSKNEKIATEIVEFFEDLLYHKEIKIPCEDEMEQRDRQQDENSACLYGMEYWNLIEQISDLLEKENK